VRRALIVLTRNWIPLLGALVLATMLYAGLVVAQDARSFVGRVPIALVKPPGSATLVEPLPDVTLIRFRAPVDIAGRISTDSFHASVDLAGIVPEPGGTPVQVRVALIATDDRIDIIDWQPRIVTVRLDPVLTRTYPVTISRGGSSDGLSVGPSQIQPALVTVSGASSRVLAINRVEGRVTIDGSAINVDADVELLPLDERGVVVASVELQPRRVHVRIEVTRQLASRTVPVGPPRAATPPAGYRIHAITVQPLAVGVSGEQPQIATIDSIRTEPVDVTGHTAPFEARVGLALPAEVTVAGVADILVAVDLRSDEGSRTFQAGVATQGAERDLEYSLSLSQVLVTLGGAVADLDAIVATTLTATVDVRGLGPGAHDLPVALRAPAGTELVTVAPPRVTVTIVAPPAPQAPSPPPVPSPAPSPSASPATGISHDPAARTGRRGLG
jgi:YbbR domain-containing protein